MVNIIDSTVTEPLRGVQRTPEGYLVADAFTARTGTQKYLGSELGRPDIGIVTVYRPESEVFDNSSVQTFAHKPITVGHPRKLVDAESWARTAVGEVSTEAMRDGDRLRLQLIVKDADAIAGIEAGSCRQLSVGYTSDILWEDGVAPDGTRYQAKQTNIRANHVALVPRGRAGNCQIGDSEWGVTPIDYETGKQREVRVDTKAVKLGDKAITVAMADAQTLLDHVADLERQLGVKDAEVVELKKKVVSDADFAASVTKRVALIDAARAKAPDVDLTKCVTDADVMRETIKKAMPTIALDGKSDGYVEGIFDTIQVSKPADRQASRPDPMQTMLKDWAPDQSLSQVNLDAALKAEDAAWQKSVASMNEGK